MFEGCSLTVFIFKRNSATLAFLIELDICKCIKFLIVTDNFLSKNK